MAKSKTLEYLRVILASPDDVKAEREAIPDIIDEVNRGVAAVKKIVLEIFDWKTDSYPGFHLDGPQGVIDKQLKIDESDLLIGIFWHHFGKPTIDADSGTEHEIRVAYDSWKKNRHPHIMLYFNRQSYSPTSQEDTTQWGKVFQLQQDFSREGLWSEYNGVDDFKGKVRQHLIQFVREWKSRKAGSTIQQESNSQRVLGSINKIIEHANSQANQELWAGVRLKDFEGILPTVTLIRLPFHDKIKDLYSLEAEEKNIHPKKLEYKLDAFVSDFFNYELQKLGLANLLNYIDENDERFPSVLFLTGTAGIGKTVSLKILTSKWEEKNNNQRILPIYIPLIDLFDSEIDPFEPNAFLARLNNYLKDRDRYGITEQELTEHRDTRFASVLLILDGFDEAALRGGQSRVTILTSIIDYCKKTTLEHTVNKLKPKNERESHGVCGIIIASRHEPTYVEYQLFSNKVTVIKLSAFSENDVSKWLDIFNKKALIEGTKPVDKSTVTGLTKDLFFNPGGECQILDGVVTTPLYLYLLSCSCVVDKRAASFIAKGLDANFKKNDESAFFQQATFQILERFLDAVRKNLFVSVSAFNQSGPPLTAATNQRIAKLDTNALIEELGARASKSDGREIDLDTKIKNYAVNVVREWAIRALPLERLSDGFSKLNKKKTTKKSNLWRFPHLSLVDFIVARRLAGELKRTAGKHKTSNSRIPSLWWTDQIHDIRTLTIEFGEMLMSDRAFDYLEQHLIMLNKSQEGIDQIVELSKAWSVLNAVIVPVKSIELIGVLLDHMKQNSVKHDNRENLINQLTDIEKSLPPDDFVYIVEARKEDRGLRIANLGLPLLGSCLRVRNNGKFPIHGALGQDDASRYILRQYLRLQSFVLDSEFANRSDVNRFPLNGLNTVNSSMEGVDMKDVVLKGGSLEKSQLQQAYLLGADLRGITIDEDCNLQNAILVGADLRGATLKPNLEVEGASFFNANLSSEAHVERVKFKFCNMVGTQFQNSFLIRATFEECAMSRAQLQNSQMNNATLTNSNLSDANLSGANLSGATIQGGLWKNAKFDGTIFDDKTKFIEPIGLPKQCIDLIEQARGFYGPPTDL